ncbi:MAG TPA: DUF4350 domain-containing protein [Vicinamibacterales bacterium]|nr:DUF4350 domain-containing protein [Vicinamibacterales bacterium]
MKRASIISAIVAVPVILLIVWIARNTYWADVKVPMPPKGEALTNPFYAAQRFAAGLGMHTSWDRVLTVPPASAVIVLSSWHWDLSPGRRHAIEQWVASGGRLVVDDTLTGGDEAFERWSGIIREYRDEDEEPDESAAPVSANPCGRFSEEFRGTAADGAADTSHWICDFYKFSFLTTSKSTEWALRGESGVQAMRVHVGLGTVTVINATPFRYRQLFDGDHGWLLVAATELRRGDELHFLSEDDHPSLLALTWQHGGPVVALSLVLLAVALWRNSVRFGPPAPPTNPARRSLAEQILGTGQFAMRYGRGESLHAAAVRALEEAVQRRIPGYKRLPETERTAALARLTGFDHDGLAAALHHAAWRRPHTLRNTVAVLEAARRQALIEHSRSSYGTF